MRDEGLRDILSLELSFALPECKRVWLSEEIAHQFVVIADVRALQTSGKDHKETEQMPTYCSTLEYIQSPPIPSALSMKETLE